MKKIIIIVLILLLIGLGLFFFLGNGREKVSDFFSDNSFGSFFNIDPNSKNSNPPINNINSTSSPVDNTGEYTPPALRQISFEPISGYTFYSTSTIIKGTTTNPEGLEISKDIISTSTVFRFQERASGHIYDVHESTVFINNEHNLFLNRTHNM